jgi:hypothetical protein
VNPATGTAVRCRKPLLLFLDREPSKLSHDGLAFACRNNAYSRNRSTFQGKQTIRLIVEANPAEADAAILTSIKPLFMPLPILE